MYLFCISCKYIVSTIKVPTLVCQSFLSVVSNGPKVYRNERYSEIQIFVFLQRKINFVHQQQFVYQAAFPELLKLVEYIFSQIAIRRDIVY